MPTSIHQRGQARCCVEAVVLIRRRGCLIAARRPAKGFANGVFDMIASDGVERAARRCVIIGARSINEQEAGDHIVCQQGLPDGV